MDELKVQSNQTDMVSLANEMTLRSYRWKRVDMQKLFQNMTSSDYLAMWILSRHIEGEEENKKIYLKDIAENLKLPMPKVSSMVRDLQEKGLVQWKHDGKGEEGTYIQITERGVRQATTQQEALKDFYQNVIEQFGKERFVCLLSEMAEMEEIMSREIEKIKEE